MKSIVLPEPKVPTIEGAEYVGAEMCAVCHVDQAHEVAKTAHQRFDPGEARVPKRGCESCHGPGSLHIQGRGDTSKILRYGVVLPAELVGKGDPTQIVRYRDLPRDRKSESISYCISCHNSRTHFDWSGSRHDLAGVACIDCHNPMKATPKLLRQQEPDLCFSCHQQKRLQATYPSHHPIREGKMKCADCHQPHGSPNRAMLKAETIPQLCFGCHAEKEGPFVHEHPPVSENCAICHDPHGTVANNLKRQEEPFLCMRCHPGHQSQLPPLTHVLSVPHKRRTFYTKCTQCHPTIHGTDLPSPSGKGRFTR